MSPSIRPLTTLTALLAASTLAVAAGKVEVQFPSVPFYADAGDGTVEIERTKRVLADHIATWQDRLPAGQTLRVEVLDIDLAGEIDHFHPQRIRVLGATADSPRLHLRFELRQVGRVLDAGEARLLDTGYLWRVAKRYEQRALHHERRMLDDWYDARLGASRTAALR